MKKTTLIMLLLVMLSPALLAAAPYQQVQPLARSSSVGQAYLAPNHSMDFCYNPIKRTFVPCKGRNHRAVYRGEPTMEKITAGYGFLPGGWTYTTGKVEYIKIGCYRFWLRIGTFKLPFGCRFRYQY